MTLALILSWFIFGLGLLLWPRPLHDYFRLAGTVLDSHQPCPIHLLSLALCPGLRRGNTDSQYSIFDLPDFDCRTWRLTLKSYDQDYVV